MLSIHNTTEPFLVTSGTVTYLDKKTGLHGIKIIPSTRTALKDVKTALEEYDLYMPSDGAGCMNGRSASSANVQTPFEVVIADTDTTGLNVGGRKVVMVKPVVPV